MGQRNSTGKSNIRPQAVAGAPSFKLKAELGRRQRAVKRLAKRRERLLEELEQVDRRIFEYGGGSPAVRKRADNDVDLGESLARLLRDREMSVIEAARAVQEAGYKTYAENFRTIVNQRLINDPRFKRVRRGVYTAKKAH